MPWNMSNPLYRWKKAHGKLKTKALSIKTRHRTVRPNMPRRRGFRRRLARYHPRTWRYRVRHRDKRFSIIGTTGAVGSLFAGATNHKSLGSWLVDFAQGRETDIGNKMPYIISDTIAQYTGYSFMDGSWNVPTGTIVLIGSSIAAGVAGKFGNKYISKIPMLGKYVKM